MICKIVCASVTCFLIHSFLLSSFLPDVAGKEPIEKFNTPLGREVLRRSKVAEIMSSIDTTQDPCDDFYTYACGNWQKLRSGEKWVSRVEDEQRILDRRIDQFLLHPKSRNDEKIFHFYRSCEEASGNFDAFQSELKNIYQEFGQFSWLRAKETGTGKGDFSWWSTVAKMYNKYGVSTLVSVSVEKDLKDPSRNSVFIYGPDAQEVGDIVPEYFTQVLGVPDNMATQIVTDLEKFRKALTDSGTEVRYGESPEEIYTLYNTSDFQEQYANLFDAEAFLMITLNTTELPDQIYVSDKTYFDDLIQIFNATDPSTVEDYMLWSLLQEYQVVEHFDCTTVTRRYFGKYLQHVIYKQYRSAAFESEMYEMWHGIKAEFQYALQTDRYQWMSRATIQKAIEKLNKIDLKLKTYDDENFEEFFRDLQIDPGNYVANVRNILERIEGMRQDKLQETPANFNELASEAYAVSYDFTTNNITVPVTNLQPFVMWHPEYPKAIKYAILGEIIAHEMMHAFDDGGRYYDGHGCINAWWDEDSSSEFELRRHCFQVQYHNQLFGGFRLPNSVSQSENIADNGAVRVAYLAYNRWVNMERQLGRNVDASETFSSLPYNHRELFFLSFAQMKCEFIDSEYASFAVNATYSPKKTRVNVPLANFPEFSEVFKCDRKANALMNPAEKCELF